MQYGKRVSIATVAACLFSAGLLANTSVFPTGVTVNKPERAYRTYVLFDGRDGKSHLIDMNGKEVRSWNYSGFPSMMIDPELIGGKRGHIFVQKDTLGGQGPALNRNTTVAELDWDGNVVWEWGEHAPGGAANQNHDIARLANGNTLMISRIVHSIPGFSAPHTADQCIYEVTPAGEIVWKWISSEHLDEMGFSEESLAMIRRGFSISNGRWGFLVINDMKPLGPNRWFDGGDNRFRPENIMIDSREGNFTAIIERKTGKIVWRMGPDYPDTGKSSHPRMFNHQVPRPVDQIAGQHDAHIIPEGLPGAGHVLVFDNQGSAGFPPAYLGEYFGSRILEIDPLTKEIVWQYNAEDSGQPLWTFFSSFISSARRLANGNTLICEGMNGRIFQITPQGEIVWEYVNPYFGMMALGDKEVRTNLVYRAQPIPDNWIPTGTP
jgi:hypothetical protein